jgi:hypothetical protein
MSLAAVIQHGESIEIAFHETGNYRRNRSDQWDQGKKQNKDGVYRLPAEISQGEPDAAADIMIKNSRAENKFFAFYDRFCFFTQIGKHRTAQDKKQIFKEGEIKEHHDQSRHYSNHN